jgi:hypothetical protein
MHFAIAMLWQQSRMKERREPAASLRRCPKRETQILLAVAPKQVFLQLGVQLTCNRNTE